MGKRRANGEGTFHQRKDGRWESTFMIGRHADGRRNRITIYGSSKTELKRKVKEWKQARKNGYIIRKDYIFSEWSEMWFEMHRPNLALSTQEGYRYSLRHLNKAFGHRKLKDIKAYDIEAFLKTIQKQGKSDSLISKLKGMMFQIMHKAEANDLITKNPAAFVDKNRRNKTKNTKDSFTSDEVKSLMQNLPDSRIGWSIRLMLGTGIRTQELLALEPHHIAEDGSKINIEQAVFQIKGTVSVGVPKTERSRRTVPVPPSLQPYAIKLRDTKDKYIWQVKKENSPCNPSYFRDQFRETLESIEDVRLLTPHCCRHTFVSQMQALGIDVPTIQSIVGHARIDMTEYYLHVQDSVKLDAMQRFSKAFEAASQTD